MPSVTENCICGAVLTYEGEAPRWASEEFRTAHAVCREAAARPQAVMPSASGVPVVPMGVKPSPNQCASGPSSRKDGRA